MTAPIVRHYVDFAPTATLAASINANTTVFDVSSLAGWPTQTPYTALLDKGTASAEIILVTAVTGVTVTATRNYNGTGAFSHPAGAELDHAAIAADYQEANGHVTATGGVHGVLGALVGTSDTQTLSNKTLSSPTINTPVVNRGKAVGSATVAALTAQAAGGGKALAGLKADGTETSNVSDLGVFNGTGVAVSGGVAASSVTASGAVSGIVQPLVYVNEAARDAAIPSPTQGMMVYLSAPTGPWPPGVFMFRSGSGQGWQKLNAGDLIGSKDDNLGAAIGLGSAGNGTFIPLTGATVTFTLPVDRWVKLSVGCDFYTPTNPMIGRVLAGYVKSATPPAAVLGGNTNPATSFASGGRRIYVAPTALEPSTGQTVEAPARLTAGTWTCYPVAERFTGGSGNINDHADNGFCAVYDAGPA